MAKISPVSIKYIIHANFESNGAIEKPDIIGAIFGQTEGLLGEDLEMRELQKSGRIGRIEVNSNYEDGKTKGEIEVPSAMDKTETAILAAALETIERIGPSDTVITIEDIEDVRGSKRDYILERAKKLMEKLSGSDTDIDEMTNEIQASTKMSKLGTYGTENLPCGDVSGDELIIVEGRADVLNLLKNGVKNVIAMNGAKLPDTIIELANQKPVVILFVDGDRGGNLIIKNVTESAKIDFIAMAPEGKEVEELAQKEILQSLRKKMTANDYIGASRQRGVKRYDNQDRREMRDTRDSRDTRETPRESSRHYDVKKMSLSEKEKISIELEDLIGTKGAVIFNDKLEKTKKIPLGKLMSMRFDEPPYIIAIDGTATPKVIEFCEYIACSNLIATNFVATDTKVNLVSL